MQHTVIPSWYQREGYIKAMANLIEKELKGFDRPEEVPHNFYVFKEKEKNKISLTFLSYHLHSFTSNVDSIIYVVIISVISG